MRDSDDPTRNRTTAVPVPRGVSAHPVSHKGYRARHRRGDSYIMAQEAILGKFSKRRDMEGEGHLSEQRGRHRPPHRTSHTLSARTNGRGEPETRHLTGNVGGLRGSFVADTRQYRLRTRVRHSADIPPSRRTTLMPRASARSAESVALHAAAAWTRSSSCRPQSPVAPRPTTAPPR